MIIFCRLVSTDITWITHCHLTNWLTLKYGLYNNHCVYRSRESNFMEINVMSPKVTKTSLSARIFILTAEEAKI